MKNKLRDTRESKKITQEELSELSGISRATISNLETKEDMNVRTSTLIALADALGEKVTDVFFIK